MVFFMVSLLFINSFVFLVFVNKNRKVSNESGF